MPRIQPKFAGHVKEVLGNAPEECAGTARSVSPFCERRYLLSSGVILFTCALVPLQEVGLFEQWEQARPLPYASWTFESVSVGAIANDTVTIRNPQVEECGQ